jgi:hypothetical protein
MLNNEPSADQRITNGYHGTEVQPQYRGVKACEYLWNKEIKNIGSFDDLIIHQLENAKRQDRTKITVLDIGSGLGNLFREFLSDVSVGRKTRNFLADNKNFTVDLIGVTDAKTIEELLTEEEITAKNNQTVDNNQIHARNIKYTLSYNQRITDVLKSRNIKGIDLCVSTVALTYLGPGTFENTMRDVINNLNSDGQMVAYEYSGITPGIVQPDPMLLRLDVRNIQNISAASLKAMLRQSGVRFARTDVSIDDEEKALEQAENLMVKLGVTTQDEIDDRRKKCRLDPDYIQQKESALIRRAGYLASDERNLISRHILKLRQIKERQLKSLFNENKDRIRGEFKEKTISFEKI